MGRSNCCWIELKQLKKKGEAAKEHINIQVYVDTAEARMAWKNKHMENSE